MAYVYLHGFNSSPASVKARQLSAHLSALGRGEEFLCPALPHRPGEAARLMDDLVAPLGPRAVLVGSSLGGFYATWLAERHGCNAVLVNPAITPHRGLEGYLGPQRNLYTGEPYDLTQTHLDELAALWVPAVTRPERYFLIATTGDEVLDYREAVARYPGARHRIVVGSDHGFAEFEQYLGEVIAFGDAV